MFQAIQHVSECWGVSGQVTSCQWMLGCFGLGNVVSVDVRVFQAR